jgi:hypothetical protein
MLNKENSQSHLSLTSYRIPAFSNLLLKQWIGEYFPEIEAFQNKDNDR